MLTKFTCIEIENISNYCNKSAEAAARRRRVKKVLLKISQYSDENVCWSLFFNKVAGIRPVTLVKQRLRHRCFPVNFAKCLRTHFLQNTSGGCF